jgi:hypothetical protein
VGITAHGKTLRIEAIAASVLPELTQTVVHMFRLDEDLLERSYESSRDLGLAPTEGRRIHEQRR